MYSIIVVFCLPRIKHTRCTLGGMDFGCVMTRNISINYFVIALKFTVFNFVLWMGSAYSSYMPQLEINKLLTSKKMSCILLARDCVGAESAKELICRTVMVRSLFFEIISNFTIVLLNTLCCLFVVIVVDSRICRSCPTLCKRGYNRYLDRWFPGGPHSWYNVDVSVIIIVDGCVSVSASAT